MSKWVECTRAPGYWRNLALFTLGVALAGVVVAAVWLAYAHTMSFVHPARIPLTHTPDDLGIAQWEDVRFRSSDGLELAGWYLPPDPNGDGATVICLHGARNQREEMLAQGAMLHRHGYGALLFDMRAHGESEGEVSTLGYAEVEDLRGAVAYLQARPEVNGFAETSWTSPNLKSICCRTASSPRSKSTMRRNTASTTRCRSIRRSLR